jgi:hypothetical protein
LAFSDAKLERAITTRKAKAPSWTV